MNIKTLSCIGFALLILNQDSFPQFTFQRTYGIAGTYIGGSVRVTADSGYILVSNDSVSATNFDITLVKTNAAGDTLWTRNYGGSGREIGYDVRSTADHGFIVTGSSTSFGNGTSEVYLLKTDSLGRLIWSRTFHKTQFGCYGSSVVEASSGGYLIAGLSSNPDSVNVNARDCYLIRTDRTGHLRWARTFGGTAVAVCVNKTFDDGFIFTGFISTGPPNMIWKAYLFRTDSTGAFMWRRTFGGVGSNEGYSVQQTSDSGFIMAGITENSGGGQSDVLLIRTNSLGDTMWTRAYGRAGYDNAESVEQTTDGGFIVAGETNSFGPGSWDVYLIKTDSQGDTLWTRTYGGSSIDYGHAVRQSFDGGYIISGFAKSPVDGRYYSYLVKTDSTGYSGCNERGTNTILSHAQAIVRNDTSHIIIGSDTLTPITLVRRGGQVRTNCLFTGTDDIIPSLDFSIYPVPTTGQFTIRFANTIDDGTINIYNLLGELVFKERITSTASKEIDLHGVSPGLYLLNLKNGEREVFKKLLVQ